MTRKGFTLIELLIVVVIIGILATIALPKFANTKYKAVVASMKTDLRNLVTAQEGFSFDNNDYAGGTINGLAVNATGGAGKVSFLPSTGNVLTLTYISNTGYKATITNPVITAHHSQHLRRFRGTHRQLAQCCGDDGGYPGLLVALDLHRFLRGGDSLVVAPFLSLLS